ncbi:peptidyl-prolyl cis-trans isomerase [Streptomyces sp. GESEQ-35]|uniref:peptidyl-prolyl cis-trans isomerase n=1 Tax=Streptomyces sp. GESEQ-35 TaxID=2812657 RepID=UPI001B344D94|nr:peptidyl-prolyl cis-trans isomerase [Streptomyces sp. GESEQ-35]
MTEHAALVHGEVLPKQRVNAFLAISGSTAPFRGAGSVDMRLRRVGATSHNESADERQRRRWATQVVVADELARRACKERGLTPPEEASPTRVLTVAEPDVADLGSIVATTLAHSPAARTLLAQLEAEQQVPEEALRDYYARNRDRFLTPEALRRGVDPFGTTAPEDVLPYARVRDDIARELGRAAGRRAFFDWFDRARAGVEYAEGHEHPGDPSHPDHEHRH